MTRALVPKATNTHVNTNVSSTATMVTRTRPIVTLNDHWLSCMYLRKEKIFFKVTWTTVQFLVLYVFFYVWWWPVSRPSTSYFGSIIMLSVTEYWIITRICTQKSCLRKLTCRWMLWSKHAIREKKITVKFCLCQRKGFTFYIQA